VYLCTQNARHPHEHTYIHQLLLLCCCRRFSFSYFCCCRCFFFLCFSVILFYFFFRYWEAISNRAQSFSSKLEDCLRLRMAIHRTPSKTADTVFSLLAAAAATSAEAIFYRLALLPAVNRFSQFTQNVSRIQIGLLGAFLTPRTL